MYGYYYYSPAQTAGTLMLVALILAIAATVLTMIFITPEKRRASLNKFFQVVADIFNFKSLLLEYIAKALYIFFTLFTVLGGFFLLFIQPLSGLLLMILGPIVTRIIAEAVMMTIILVKNVIQLNNKIPNKNGEEQQSPFFTPTQKPDNAAPQPPVMQPPVMQPPVMQPPVSQPPAPQPDMAFCMYCGTRYDKNQGGCPNGCTPPAPPAGE